MRIKKYRYLAVRSEGVGLCLRVEFHLGVVGFAGRAKGDSFALEIFVNEL